MPGRSSPTPGIPKGHQEIWTINSVMLMSLSLTCMSTPVLCIGQNVLSTIPQGSRSYPLTTPLCILFFYTPSSPVYRTCVLPSVRWSTELITIHCTKKFLWWGLKVVLIYKYTNTNLEGIFGTKAILQNNNSNFTLRVLEPLKPWALS